MSIAEHELTDDAISQLVQQRQVHRQSNQYKEADQIRADLLNANVIVFDHQNSLSSNVQGWKRIQQQEVGSLSDGDGGHRTTTTTTRWDRCMCWNHRKLTFCNESEQKVNGSVPCIASRNI